MSRELTGVQTNEGVQLRNGGRLSKGVQWAWRGGPRGYSEVELRAFWFSEELWSEREELRVRLGGGGALP